MSRIKYPSTWDQRDRDALDNMFEIARAKELWFYCNYQRLWFTPDELENEQLKGNFLRGAGNWELRKPREFFHEAREQFEKAKTQYKRALERYFGETTESNAEVGRMLGI